MEFQMKRGIFIIAFLFLSGLGAALWAKGGDPIPFQLDQDKSQKLSNSQLRVAVEQDIFAETNQIRVKKGLPALKQRDVLVLTGRDHSRDMLKRNYLSHISPEGKSVVDRVNKRVSKIQTSLGENVHTIFSSQGLYDPKAIAGQMMQDWMHSTSHRDNILSKKYSQLGVGCYTDGQKIYCTQVFAGPNL